MGEQLAQNLSQRINTLLVANPPPYIHCSKINCFLIDLKKVLTHLNEECQEPQKRTKKPNLNSISVLVQILDEFQQLHLQCCHDSCATFTLTSSLRGVREEFVSMRKDAAKSFENLGFNQAAQDISIADTDLDSQDSVDIRRIALIIDQLQKRNSLKARKDISDLIEERCRSLQHLGISLAENDNELITIPELPESMNYVLMFDDLDMQQQIGEGQSGVVYRGMIKSLQQEVAIKCLKTRTFSTFELEMFRREIFTMAVLSHPSLIRLYGYTAEPPYCIVTEYMLNGSVASFLKERGSELTPTDRTLIALDVARGIEFLHSRGIIHRDLKSLNVLLDENKRAKICDFGLVRMKSNIVMTGLIGTSMWMAPEVLVSSPNYDEKVDVYSFGVLLWELLTGRTPNKDKKVEAVIDILENQRKLDIPENTPPDLRDLIKSCWQIDPKARPTFHEIIQKLSDPACQMPGSEHMLFLQEAGLQKRVHGYSASSPLYNSRAIKYRRNNSDHVFQQRGTLALKAVERISEAISIGHIEHFNNALHQLRAAARSSTTDLADIVPAFLEVYDRAPARYQSKLGQVLFEIISNIDPLHQEKPNIFAELLSSNNETLANLALSQICSMKTEMLFNDNAIDAILAFSTNKNQQIRMKALSILVFYIENTEVFNNNFPAQFIAFGLRKLPVPNLEQLCSSLHKVLSKATEVQAETVQKLIVLSKSVPSSCYISISRCLQDVLKFETIQKSQGVTIWTFALTNISSFQNVFLMFTEKLPVNPDDFFTTLCTAAEKSDEALCLLTSFTNYSSLIVAFLPINNLNLEVLGNLYYLLIEKPETYSTITKLPEFYSVIPSILDKSDLTYLYQIMKNDSIEIKFVKQFKISSAIVTQLNRADTVITQIQLIGIIYSLSLREQIPEFDQSIPIIQQFVISDNKEISSPAFLCLALLSKNHSPLIQPDVLVKCAAIHLSNTSTIYRNASIFVIRSYLAEVQITTLKEMAILLLENDKESNEQLIESARMLVNIASKRGGLTPALTSRLCTLYQ